RKNVRVVEPGDRHDFALEEVSCFPRSLGVRGLIDFGPDHLDSYLPVSDACIFCKVDFAHPAFSQGLPKTIWTKLLAFESHRFLRELESSDKYRNMPGGSIAQRLWWRKLLAGGTLSGYNM